MCSISLFAQIRVTEVPRRCVVINGFQNVVVRQFPAQYFSMLSGFHLLKLTRLSGVFTLSFCRFFKAGKNVKLYYITLITNFNL